MSRLGVVAALLALVACGDESVCPSDVFVAIQTSQVTTDVDAAAPGIQSDVRVRTSLFEGEEVTLEVFASNNLPIGTSTATVDADGVAIFEAVTITGPEARIRASVSVECGDASDELVIPVSAGAACTLVFVPPPSANTFYTPALVYNTLDDPDPATAGFQTLAVVRTDPDTTVELFEHLDGSGEQSLGTFTATAGGLVEVERALLDGLYSFRAFCSQNQTGTISATTTLVVDVTPPTCEFASPPPGTTITPAFDNNLDLDDGIQLLVTAQVLGDDIQDEPTTLTVTPLGGSATAVTTTKIDSDGRAGGFTTLTTPGTFTFEFTTRDHAENVCSATEDYVVVFEACELAVTAPTAPVTVDAAAAAGTQVDISVLVSANCVGRTVTSTCGSNDPSGTVPAGGALTLRANWCATSPCELAASCELSVSTVDGVVTSTTANITFDDQGPATTVAVVTPAVACGSTIDLADDIDPSTAGVQVLASVTAAGSTTRSLEHTSTSGTTTVAATSDVVITVEPGLNTLVGIATDALDNETRTANCNVTLAGLTIAYSPPAADGLVVAGDGTVTGPFLTFPLCGTVSLPGAAVSLVIDGDDPVAATVTGTTWCSTVKLRRSPPSHTIVATATVGGDTAVATLTLDVDTN